MSFLTHLCHSSHKKTQVVKKTHKHPITLFSPTFNQTKTTHKQSTKPVAYKLQILIQKFTNTPV